MTQTMLINGMSGSAARAAINNGIGEAMARAHMASGTRPIVFGTAGDSIAEQFWNPDDSRSPLFWACARDLPAQMIYDRQYHTGVAGSPSANLVQSSATIGAAWPGGSQGNNWPAQIDLLESWTTKPDIMFVQTMQNDATVNGVANVTAYATRALAAGVRLVIIASRPPSAMGQNNPPPTGVARLVGHINAELCAFCAVTPGCLFVDMYPLLRSTTTNDDHYIPFRSGFSEDGTHPTTLAGYATSALIADIMRPIARRMDSPRASLSIDHDPVNFPRGNMLGRVGMMDGTGGTLNGIANNGVAGDQYGTYPNQVRAWRISCGDGVVVAPSIIVGNDGYKRQRLSLSGTTTAATEITMTARSFYPVTNATLSLEALVDFVSVPGVCGIYLQSLGIDMGGAHAVPFQGLLTEQLFLKTRRKRSGLTQPNGTDVVLRIAIAANTPLSGYVDIGRVGMFQDA